MKKVTINDIAKAAQVSVATVSLVLNGKKVISPETEARVREVIKSLNYQPRRKFVHFSIHDQKKEKLLFLNKTLSRCSTVGFALVGNPQTPLSPIYCLLYQGIMDYFVDRGYMIKIIYGTNTEDLVKNMLSAGWGGYIFLTPLSVDQIKSLSKIPLVRVMGEVEDSLIEYDHITYDNRGIGILVSRYLRDLGIQNAVGLHIGQTIGTENVCVNRVRAFVEVFNRSNGEGKSQIFNHEKELLNWVQSLKIEKDLIPSAIFCSMDKIVRSFYLYWYSLWGEDSLEKFPLVIGCNNDRIFLNDLVPPPLSVNIHAYEVGYLAAEQLLKRMEKPSLPFKKEILQPSLVFPPSDEKK